MAETREDAIKRLKELIKEQRARIDPAVLARAGQTAEAIQAGKAPRNPSPAPEKTVAAQQTPLKSPAAPASPVTPDGSVPYDRKAAARAVELFLTAHKDGEEFQKKLLSFLKKNSQ